MSECKLVARSVPGGDSTASVEGIESKPPEDLMRSRIQFQDAVDLIDGADKEAYLEAMHRIPQIVTIETNTDHYLEASNYDPWSAARRLCDHWRIRRDWFGERAFLPMTISGEGALTKDDVE